jgi:Tfp pilus assembly protein PilF
MIFTPSLQVKTRNRCHVFVYEEPWQTTLHSTDFWQLRELLARHDYAAAYTLYEGCLQRRPDDAALLLLAGRTARRAGMFEQAGKHLYAYRRLKGENPSFTLEMSLLRLQRGDERVESYLRERAEAGDADAPLIWETLSQYYLDGYRLIEARDCLDRYLEHRPNDVAALLGRGFIWERLLHFLEAVRDFRMAVDIEPDNERARLRLADNLLIVGPPQQAAEQFEWLRSRHPEDVAAQLGLARAWRQMGRMEPARELLDGLLREHPRNAGVLTERGRIALEEGHPHQAADWLRRAVALAPHDRETLYNLSRCLQQCGPENEARACQLRFERADADLKRLGQLTKEVLREPRNPALRCEGGLLFLRAGEEEEGIRWLNQALRLDPGYRPAHAALADYYQGSGKSELAAHHRRLAEESQQTPPPSHRTPNTIR